MQLDFEIQRCTRRCAATNRALEAGETCYTVLEVQGGDIIRKDISQSAWTGPPPNSFAWWKSLIPEPNANKIKLAPNDVLLELFDQLADQPECADMRYVLALLLVRRRVLRSEATVQFTQPSSPENVELLTVFCPKRGTSYEVPVAMPDDARIDAIQQHLSGLLVAGGGN